MTIPKTRSPKLKTLAAIAFLAILAGLFTVRLMARGDRAEAPQADVPAPAVFSAQDLAVPCWSCPHAVDWRIRFQTNLDLLAPLGNGPGNAATFFAQFEKTDGPRAAEAAAFMARRKPAPEVKDFVIGDVVPADDPLLLEAEPWVDQSTMHFYPDLLPVEGANTRLPNLMFMIALARSWTAHGVFAADPQAGLDQCRRAIRLGRLLRQEDAVMINDLVGLACIHIGTRGVYEIARKTGNTRLALLASVVIGEVAPQRLYTSQRINSVLITDFLHKDDSGTYQLSLPDEHLDAIVEMATSCPDRRFRGEAILDLIAVESFGTPEQQQRARSAIDQIIAGDDPIMSELARTTRATNPEKSLLEQMVRQVK